MAIFPVSTIHPIVYKRFICHVTQQVQEKIGNGKLCEDCVFYSEGGIATHRTVLTYHLVCFVVFQGTVLELIAASSLR